MVVSSLTPRSSAATFVQRDAFSCQFLAQQIEDDAPLFRLGLGVERRHLAGLLEFDALVHQQRRVPAVVDDLRRTGAVGPHQRLARAPPVLVERLALPREHRDAARVGHGSAGFRSADHDRGGGVILGREDVARDPAHVGAEIGERLDEHRRLDGHVQAAHDAGAGERGLALVAGAQRHQAGHLLLGQANLLAPELGERQIPDLIRLAANAGRRIERMHLTNCGTHSRYLSLLSEGLRPSDSPTPSLAGTPAPLRSGGALRCARSRRLPLGLPYTVARGDPRPRSAPVGALRRARTRRCPSDSPTPSLAGTPAPLRSGGALRCARSRRLAPRTPLHRRSRGPRLRSAPVGAPLRARRPRLHSPSATPGSLRATCGSLATVPSDSPTLTRGDAAPLPPRA